MTTLSRAVAGLLLIALPATVAGAEPLTARGAVAEALDRNPSIAIARANRDVAAAALTEARGGWLPRLDASHTLARSDNPVFVFGSLLEQGRFGPQNFDPAFLNDPDPMKNHRVGLNARFPVFDQFRRLNGNRMAANALRQAGYGVDEATQAIQVETLSRFYGVVLATGKKDVAQSAVRAAEAGARAMRDRFEQGLLVESDVLAAEVQLARFRQQLIEAEGELASARAALNSTLGREIMARTEVDGSLGEVAPVRMSLEEALVAAVANRGAAKTADVSVRNADLQLQSARGALLPRLDTFASWNASAGSWGDWNSDQTYGFVISLDLFDPSKFTRVARARAERAAADAAARSARDRVALEVVQAWNRVRSAEQRLALATTAAEQAGSVARIVHDRYENGLTTITEELRAQTALVSAQLDLLASRYDLKIGNAELLRATGGLHDVDQF